jgi:cytochrome c553
MRLSSRASAGVLIALILAPATAHASDPKKISYGRHLAAECTSCHRIDGTDNGIPSIIGWDVAEFVQTMAWYKDGARPNPAMRSVAESLDDQQTEALALYFASLPKPAAKK